MQFLAAIQAGGQSRRMGTDKAWLELDGHPMIEHVLHAARPVAHRLAIVISQTTREPERYAALAAKWHATLLVDPHELRGPLGGIETALHACQSEECAIILACDLPFLTAEFLRKLCDSHNRNAASLTVPTDPKNRLQMLCCVYSPSCLLPIKESLSENQLRADRLCDKVQTYIFPWNEYSSLPQANRLLTNINSPEEFRQNS